MRRYPISKRVAKYNCLYQVTNLVNNKIYIGVHQTNNLNDSYLGSGKLLRKAIEKYGKHNFKKTVLGLYLTPREMYTAEARLLTEEFVERDDVYNLAAGGRGGRKGMVVVKDKNGIISVVHKTDIRYIVGDLKHHWTGRKHKIETKRKIREAILQKKDLDS